MGISLRAQCIMILCSCTFLLTSPNLYATTHATLSLELRNASLSDAIYNLAKFLNMNIIVSSTVHGETNVYFHDARPTQAFDLLLAVNGLAKWQLGNIYFIASREELIQAKQHEEKWQSILQETAPLVSQTFQIKYGKADEIARFIHNEHASLLSKRGQISIDSRTNILNILDIQQRVEHIYKLVKQLDMPLQQILIQARIASVENDFQKELGIKFFVISDTEEKKIFSNSMQQSVKDYSLMVAKLADASWLDVKLAALESRGHAEIISRPSLFTTNQQAASIEAGEDVPYQELSDGGGTAISFKKAVLSLKVTPEVLPGRKVLLHLQINQDRPSGRIILGMPTISTRQINTSVVIQAGETVILGGIYEAHQERGRQNLPFINKIPLIGLLFGQHHARESKRELLIFVTPLIVTETV